jgi:hypothetical protein
LKEYLAFWIKEEFAYHYFYKNDILHRFLSSYQGSKDRWDLAIQFDYITNEIPKHMLISHLKMIHSQHVQAQRKVNPIEIYNDQQYMTLHIHEKHLEFYCDRLYDAEELLFPTLRIFQPLLFVMNKTNKDEYGWISPVTKNRKYNNGQILYSYH